MEQNPSREAGQEIPHILWNLKVYYLIHKCPQLPALLLSKNKIVWGFPHLVICIHMHTQSIFSLAIPLT